MSTRRIIDAFERWEQEKQSLVMATVYATEGSTYSKAGHRIVIASNGDYQGLISGGCLEGDLAEHARSVIDTGRVRAVTYDLRDDADEIWGMGIGCNGVIKVLLQRLDAEDGYEPFESVAQLHLDAQPAICATIVDSETAVLPLGATLVGRGNDYLAWQIPDEALKTIRQQCENTPGNANPRLLRHDLAGQTFTVLYAPLKPVPRLLILGAGPDAVPLLNMAEEVGWLVTVVDHRSGYL